MEQGLKYAKLSLDEPRSIYYSGQVLSGHIECELSQPINFSVININYIGEAKVFWTEPEYEEYNGVRRCLQVKYAANEEYFNFTQRVAGGMGVSTLPPGSHKIPFQFQIPHTAPSTFTGERGSISYKVIAYIEYPDPTLSRDHLEKAFEVVAPLDLNTACEDIKRPLDLELEEYYSCCCSSSPLNITIHLPTAGYCPGQAIPITVNALNETNAEVKKITFQLIQKECYHSKEPMSDYIPPEKVLETMNTGPILSGTKRELNYELVVPAMIALNLENCSIIDVGYFLKVTIKMSGCNDDLEDESEICLGLVPLQSLLGDRHYEHPMKSDLPQAPIPDQQIVVSSHLQNNTSYPTPIQNVTAYPTSGQYPNSSPYQPGYPQPNPAYYPHGPQPGSYPNQPGSYPSHPGSYPNQPGSYPNQPGSYPNSNPYPNHEGIPLTKLPDSIGFAMPQSPPHPEPNVYPNKMGSPGYHGYNAPSAPPPN